ncbi:MAG: ATP-binding cassette domain-containing protein, partial [Candidatus Dormibacteraeota bacterium]|nr:ATP-binding cassette domain-containing protein [Candidatus Dormibacteraeota bacterium]
GSPILDVRDLLVHYRVRGEGALFRRRETVHAVDGVSFILPSRKTLGLVGESGCGKSTTGRNVLFLERPTGGTVLFDGTNLGRVPRRDLEALRRRMQIVFQDPVGSLNPRLTVGQLIGEPLLVHDIVPRPARRERVAELLQLVGLPEDAAGRYPHEFSGGQCQRIGIARALAAEPSLLVLDEPVSALDVSIQAQILQLLTDLQDRLGLSYLFIAHDLAVVGEMSDQVAVMYLGQIVELADRDALYATPHHPYTQALFSAVPVADPKVSRSRERVVLSGEVPSSLAPPSGCRFRTRCPLAEDRCRDETPRLRSVSHNGGLHTVACHFAEAAVRENPFRLPPLE